MKYIKFNFYSIILVLSMIILSGCNSELLTPASNNEEDLSDMPKGVQDGTVSVNYYKDMRYMMTEYLSFAGAIFEEGITVDEIETKARNYIVNVNSIDLLPETKADEDIDNYSLDFKIKSQLVAESMIDFATKGDKMYYDMATDYIQDTTNAFKLIEHASINYNIEY